MKRRKAPEPGQRVHIKDEDREYEGDGLVDWVGATQFAADCDDGMRRIMLVNNSSIEWRVL